ncbi:serine hydrolase [Ruminococcus sp. AF24-32LB]|nr:serine hydrolase [Ruminococcus sp. AM58-7XD]RHG55306.1 serine hydrolase [Ruminococcus sp. AM22-13]RHO90921.1 serine hydrolase [Ruminococcus sp. AF42-9BH]RHQ67129.1 serine hydrolase [Ruminococcus sp. AF24-32LB]
MKNSDNNNNETDRFSKSEKPVFLYTVIGVLTVAVIALAAVSFLSLNHLVTLQQKVQTLSNTVQDISTDANTLISQADQLDELREQESSVQTTTGETTAAAQSESPEPAPGSEQEGTLSPSSGTTFTDNTDSSMDNLLNQVQSLLPTDNGTWSVYVCNLLKDSDGTINDTPMQAASLIKLYIMGAVYENYGTIAQSHNSEEIDSNISAMISVSDNDAANTLVNWLGNGNDAAGMAKVNNFCQEHGFTSTQMNRLLLAGKENGDNYTSVKDCGTFLKQIYQVVNGTLPSSTLTNADAMYFQLKTQQRKNKIPAQLPEGVGTANKTGELDTVENDAAIIYDTAKGIDLVVCFMSQDLTDTGAAQSTIAADARAIYGYYNE